MPRTPSTIDALHQFVERTYAAGITAPYDTTIFGAVLSLANVGFGHQQRMIDLAAAMLNDLTDADRQEVMNQFEVPGAVQRKIGSTVEWPEPRMIDDLLAPFTPEQETAYREQLERAINYHAEAQAARVITVGIRKQHTYREKRREAEELLAKQDPAAEAPEDWPYLNAEVRAGFNIDIVEAAQTVQTTVDSWKAIDSEIERITRTGIRRVRNAPIDNIGAVVRETNDRVTSVVDGAVVS